MSHSFPKTKQSLAVILLSILLSFHPAYAQNIDLANDLTELSLDELMDVTIVSASKREQKLSHVAASAFVIKDEDIKRYGYRTLGEALKRISGLYLSSDRNYDYLGVRGFSLPGDYNSRILVLIDGHRGNISPECNLHERHARQDTEGTTGRPHPLSRQSNSALPHLSCFYSMVNYIPFPNSNAYRGMP